MSTTLSANSATVTSSLSTLTNGQSSSSAALAAGLLNNAGLLSNVNGSALNQTTLTNGATPSSANNQVSGSNLYNLGRGMKENFFIAAINQINQTANGKQQAVMNGIQQNQSQSGSLVQQFSQAAQNASLQNASQQLHQQQQNVQSTANSIASPCHQPVPQQQLHYQQQLSSALRLKNLNNTALINSAAMYRAFTGVNTANIKAQQQVATNHQQLMNGLNQGVLNQSTATPTTSSPTHSNGHATTGNILLNISNHNNHTNSHFNHYNQHQNGGGGGNQPATAGFFNGYPLNYHLPNGPTHHYYHSNSLSSSPRSSTSSTSSSLINYTNNSSTNNSNGHLQNGLSKYQNGQHSPASSASSPTAINAPNQQLSNHQPHKQLSNGQQQKIKNNSTANGGQQQQQQANGNGGQGQPQNGNSSRYKTELCRPFEESGFCKYSDKCQYAHGLSELRSLVRHPKYKTQLCKTYHSSGFCPYGPRCHFIHGSSNSSATSLLTMDGSFPSSNGSSTGAPANGNVNNAVVSAVVILNNALMNGGNTKTASISNNSAKSSIDSIEINTASSGISSMGSSNTNSVGSASSSPSTSPQQTIFPNLNQSQQLKKSANKLQDLILPSISPSGSSGSGSPLQQQLSSLSSKSDDVFYKYL